MSGISEQTDSQQPIVARAGRYYRNTRYIMTAVLIAMGAWFGYDGFVAWPQGNARRAELEAKRLEALRNNDQALAQKLFVEQSRYKHRSDADILLQKILCFSLPPLGIILLIRALYNSRGEYVLAGQVLRVPGHPPVPFENITSVDRRLWDRKGIAYVNYDLGDGRRGRLRLDDFVYERAPTDEIFKRIEQYRNPEKTEARD